MVAQQLLQLARGQLGHGQLVARRAQHQEVLEEQRYVFTPLAQRRQIHRGDAQAVVQVFAKLALFAQVQQIHLGGGHHAAVDGNEGVGAQAFEHTLLQHAQQLDLHGHGHALDFIEEQRATAGMFQLANAPLARAGEGPGFVAKHFAVEKRVGQPAAVDGHKVALAAWAGFVQAAGHQLLAGAGLAVDQHIHRAGS